ncbi:MAG: HAMP domain-containing sensor histidine kinase [Deltaproteobacteria bacterium]|nr:HAMP domain-containing sensor histidine kinase [Deltaproteobacteria bacterium]
MDDIDTVDRQTQTKFLGIIISESDRLTRLISSILELQKIQADRMKLNRQDIQLSPIVESCIGSLTSLAQREDLKISFACQEPLPSVHADKDKIYQILFNLISNAIKFSKKNGEIKIKAAASPEGILISVADQGIGIPADKLEKIFERFFQVDNLDDKPRMGTGLGLAITKELVERHGGRIWVESKPGEGSKFSFILPNASAGDIAAAA